MTGHREELAGSLQEQAGYWIALQHSGDWSADDEAEFKQWLAQSDQHRQAFHAVDALWQGLDDRLGQAALLSDRHHTATPKPSRSPRFVFRIGLAACVLALIVFNDASLLMPQHASYATGHGERRNVTLADGSQLILNTDTELEVALGPLSRELRLKRGEAAFSVAHQGWRPFTVNAGAGRVLDIGTRFSLYRTDEHVEVTVTEGRVDVITAQTSQALSAGQQLSYGADGMLSAVSRPDLLAATAWQEGRMVLNMTPLSQITEQMMRYHAARFAFDDPKLEQLQVSGTFNIDDLPVFLDTLQSIYPLQAVVAGDGVIHFKTAIPHRG